MNIVAFMWTWLSAFLPRFRCHFSVFTQCFSAAGLEQMSQSHTCLYISAAYQSLQENFSFAGTSDARLLHPRRISSFCFFIWKSGGSGEPFCECFHSIQLRICFRVMDRYSVSTLNFFSLKFQGSHFMVDRRIVVPAA